MSAREFPVKRAALHLCILVFISLAWGALVFHAVENLPLGRWHEWDQSDMHSYLEQAKRLAAGDWLAREPYYPYHLWMSAAPAEKWRAWYAPQVFYQAPLYSYLLAIFMKSNLDPAHAARVVQWLALALICVGVYFFSRRLFGRNAAFAAGLIMAFNGPLLMIATQPLKETLALALLMWILVAVAKAVTHPIRSIYFIVGLGLGVLATLHEGTPPILFSILFLLALRALAIAKHELETRNSKPGTFKRDYFSFIMTHDIHRNLLLLLLGIFIAFSWLLTRNIIAGAPPFAVSTRSSITWALANEASAPSGGVTFSPPTPTFVAIMDAANHRPFGILVGVIHSYGHQWYLFFAHWLARALALLSGGEAADNTCYAYFRLYVPALAVSLDFRWLLPLAAAGFVRSRPRRWIASFRRGSIVSLIPIYFILLMIALSAVFPLGRLRLFLIPALAPLAGRGVIGLWLSIRRRHPWRILEIITAIILIILLQFSLDRVWHLGDLRPADFGIAAQIDLKHGRPDLAIEELTRGAELLQSPQLKSQADAIKSNLR